MSQPVICPGCDRIVVVKQNQSSCQCSHCGEAVGQQSTKSSHSNPQSPMGAIGSPTVETGSWKMSEELQWSLILMAVGVAFLVWGITSPETTVKRRSWSQSAGTPVGWMGGLFLTIGVIGTMFFGLFCRDKSRE